MVTSKYEEELWLKVNNFSEKTSRTKSLRSTVSDCVSTQLQRNIDGLASSFQEQISNAELYKDHNAAVKERLLHLFSVQDDLTRQTKDSNIMLSSEEQISSKIARKEPLDAESQKMRRAIVSKCHKVQSLISTAEDRLALNKDIFLCSTDHQHGLSSVRASEYFNQWSKSPTRNQQTAKGATQSLFKTLTTGYDRVREFDPLAEYISKEATSMAKIHEGHRRRQQLPVKQTVTKSRFGSKTTISPRPTSHLRSPYTSRSKKPTESTNTDIQLSTLERQKYLRQITNSLSSSTKSGEISTKTFHLRGQMIAQDNTQAKIPDWRSKGRNELYSNLKGKQTSLVKSTSPAVAKTLFSSPIAGTTARPDWTVTSERDKALLKVNIPQQLKYIDHADAAKAALAKFGTTPEKLAKGREAIAHDEAQARVSLKSPSARDNKLNTSAASNAPAPQFGMTKPPTAAAFPPLSTSSPKPLSQSLNQSKPTEPSTQTRINVDYKSALAKFFQANDPAKVVKVDEYLSKYQGKEAEMFVSFAKRYDKPNAL